MRVPAPLVVNPKPEPPSLMTPLAVAAAVLFNVMPRFPANVVLPLNVSDWLPEMVAPLAPIE